MQQLTLAGTVGRDAELRHTQGGDDVLNFSLAIDNGKDGDGNKRDPSWFDCSLWGKRASSLAAHIRKGGKLTVTGRPTAREHNGKVYMGCNVSELTFMGGSRRDDAGGYSQAQSAQQASYQAQSPGGYGAGGSARGDMDDEIPF